MLYSNRWEVVWRDKGLYYSDVFDAVSFGELIRELALFKHRNTIVTVNRLVCRAKTEPTCIDLVEELR